MKLLIDMLAGLVAMLAAAALSHFGVDLNQNVPQAEITRVHECPASTPSASNDTPTC